MRIIALLIFLLTSSASIAQQAQDSLRSFKHELYLDTRSGLIFLMGADDWYPQAGISYKYVINEKGAVRAGLRYIGINNAINYSQPITLNDSLYVYDNISFYSNNRLQGNIGYEFIKGKKKLKIFYGADLAYSRYASTSGITRMFDHTNNSSNQQMNYMLPDSAGPARITRNVNNLFQVNVFCGLKYPVSRHFMIAAQAGIGAQYIKGKARVTQQGDTYGYSFWSFGTTDMALLNDISIVYRF